MELKIGNPVSLRLPALPAEYFMNVTQLRIKDYLGKGVTVINTLEKSYF